MNRIPVAIFNYRAKAEPLQERLAAAGVPAEIHDELRLEKLWFVAKPAAGVRLEVPAQHFERACRLLQSWDVAEGALREAVRCPECKSLRVDYPQFTRKSLVTNVAIGLVAALGAVEKEY